MRPPIPHFVRWTVVIAVIAALVVAVVQYWQTQQVASGTPDGGWTQTQWGPLGPADRDMLIKVRQAGLWEIPTGQQAQQQASSERVREVGGLLAAEHTDLDAQVREVAAQLGVLLPNQPSDQQQAWMVEIAGQSGSDFDRVFVQRLRAAHGKVLPVLAGVRSGTRNELVRSFAATAATFVTRHHEYLESTGLVDFSALPEPPAPATGPPPAGPAAPVPAAAAPAPGATGPGGPGLATGHEQHVNPVAQSTAAGGGGVYIAALVYIASLLAIVGLLCLLGNAGLRARQNRHRSRRAGRAAAQSGAHTAPQPRIPASAQPPLIHAGRQPPVHGSPRSRVHAAVQPEVHLPAQPEVHLPAQPVVHLPAQPVVHPAPPPRQSRQASRRSSVPPAPQTPPQQARQPAPHQVMHTHPPQAAHTVGAVPTRPRHAAQRW